jgi:hypothetical protein
MKFKMTGLQLLNNNYKCFSSEAYVELTKTGDSVSWRFWGIWIFALALIFTVFFAVIDVAPFLHLDEFMTIDLGRVILQPKSDWSIAWMMDRDQPAFVFFYLGPVFQELVYQMGGQYGPRISGIIGAFVAATAMIGWLLARGTSRNAVLVFGLIFLLDPIFVQAYTIGRVDGWAMAACLVSCWLLRDLIYRSKDRETNKRQIILAGMTAAIAFFIWPSVSFLFPLLFLELIYLVKSTITDNKNSWKANLFPFVLFGIGSIIATTLLIIPIAAQVYELFNNVVEGLLINTRFGAPGELGMNSRLNLDSLILLFNFLKFSPILLLFAFIGCIKNKETLLFCACMFAIIVMLCTVVYSHRIQYLLPYFIIGAAGLYKFKGGQDLKTGTSFMKTGGLMLLLVWSVGLSLIARTLLALDYNEERQRRLIYQAANKMIGPGNYSVYSHTCEFYYAGRSLGWRMYKPYLAVGDNPFINGKVLQQIFSHVEYLILQQEQLTQEVQQQLNESGMIGVGTYSLYNKSVDKVNSKITNADRLRHFYFIPRQPYGPYRLFAREKAFKIKNVSSRLR